MTNGTYTAATLVSGLAVLLLEGSIIFMDPSLLSFLTSFLFSIPHSPSLSLFFLLSLNRSLPIVFLYFGPWEQALSLNISISCANVPGRLYE